VEKKSPVESPIACEVGGLDAQQRSRQRAVLAALRSSFQEVREMPEGYAFRLPASASSILTVAEFISLERVCCPFLDFTLEVGREGGPLWLRLGGREGGKEFLGALFNSAAPEA
jgi:hypothetical protein